MISDELRARYSPICLSPGSERRSASIVMHRFLPTMSGCISLAYEFAVANDSAAATMQAHPIFPIVISYAFLVWFVSRRVRRAAASARGAYGFSQRSAVFYQTHFRRHSSQVASRGENRKRRQDINQPPIQTLSILAIKSLAHAIASSRVGRTGISPRASRYISGQPSLSVILGGQECLLR